MCESQGRWELRKLSKSGGCGGRWWAGNRFWFPSKVDNLEVPSNRGRDGCGGGWRIEPQFFILFSELGVGPILLSFQDWYLSLILYLRWSCSLVSSFGRSNKPAKQGNEIKTKHKNVVAAIRVKVHVFQERLKIISPFFFLTWPSEVNCIKIYLITWRTRDASLQNGFTIEQTLLHSVGELFLDVIIVEAFLLLTNSKFLLPFQIDDFLGPNFIICFLRQSTEI